jgi:alkanesulfonate monooxygenase SsuD/methylene tetrahydromethanopterin reductase-like flavin-dependent oxidoreductase (luciferase family)
VKISAFNLFSHRDLPGDFVDRYHSVWVDTPWHGLATPEDYGNYYRWGIEELVYAAKAGFDGICVNEHHQNAYGGTPSPNIMGGILAHSTNDTNAAIVQMGSTLPTTVPPMRVAEEYAMLDCISNGRLVAGMPIGTPMDANLCYGISPIEQRERYYEAHDLILKAWQAEEQFAWNGKYFQLPIVNLWPRPVQKPHPPVHIPGISSISTWDFVARNDYHYCMLSAFAGTSGLNGARAIAQGFWDHMSNAGVEMNPFRLGFAINAFVSETDAQAERDYAKHISYFWTNLTHVAREFWSVPGYYDYKSLANMLRRFGLNAVNESLAGWSYSDYLNKQVVIAGSPETVAQQLEQIAKEMRFGHLMILTQLGSMPVELTRKNTDLLANEVLPRLRPLWEGEYKNRWWPERLLQATPASGRSRRQLEQS